MDVTCRVSSPGSVKKSALCESGCRTGRSQTTRGIRKRCRIRAGWRHEWVSRTQLPSRSVLAIREIVRGPFSSPRLVGASPYVLVSSYCKDEDPEACKSTARCPRIKRGIPDAWADYLAYRGFCSKDDRRIIRRDLELGCKNIYVTARVWKDLGLPLGQGIPDPWKIPAGRKSWVGKRGVELQAEKRQLWKKRQYCGYCKRCQASTRIPTAKGYSRIDKIAPGVDSSSLNPPQVCQRETRQHRQNFIPGDARCSPECPLINKPDECTAPCNTYRYKHRSNNGIGKPPFPTTQASTGMSLAFPAKPKNGTTPRGEQQTLEKRQQQMPDPRCGCKSYQPQVSATRLSQEIRTAKKLINSGVQTSDNVPVGNSTSTFVQQKFLTPECANQSATPMQFTYGFYKQQVHSNLNKMTIPCHPCGCHCQEQFSIQDAACACQNSNGRKKRVGFETTNVPCNETVCNRGRQNLNQNLNVTQLSCGCVHVSPCMGMQEYFGAENGRAGFGPTGGTSFPANTFHGEHVDQSRNENPVHKSTNSKPKMISCMKRLINRYKPAGRSHHAAGRAQAVTSKIPVSKIPDEAKLVCCQCNCPYLKMRNSPQESPPKTVATKKKCVCTRCVAKREKRERHRSRKAAAEAKEASVSPGSCGRHVQVKRDQRITIKCHNGSCRMQNGVYYTETLCKDAESLQGIKQRAIYMNSEESYAPSAPQRNSTIINEMKESCELTEKLSADVISLEAWRYPAAFGAPWYSSDSGENADVSEVSRHTVQCTSMLDASPEMALVTSCTFISRINHNTVFQCKKKQQRRPKREERLKPPLQLDAHKNDSESLISENSLLRLNSPQTPTPTNGSYKPKVFSNQIPLLNIEELESKDLGIASSTIAGIDPPAGFASFYKNEEMSEPSSPTKRDKNREDSFAQHAESKKKEIGKNSNGSTVDGSQVTVNVDSMASHNRPGYSPWYRTHMFVPITDIKDEKLTVSDQSREVQELKNSANPKDVSDSTDTSRSSKADDVNPGYEPTINTIVSPRKITINSSMFCIPASCTQKCRKAPVPTNTSTDVSSEDQGLPSGGQNTIVYRCEVPFVQGPYIAKTPVVSNNTPKSLDLTPWYTSCTPEKMDGFFVGEGMRDSNLNTTKKSENEFPRKFVKEVQTLVQNGIYQGGKNGSADTKCFLKYCSLRRSEPCIISPSRKLLRVQHPSYLSNENDEDCVSETTEKEFPPGRRAFSSCSNQRNRGNAFDRISTHLLAKVQDKFNIG